jgi:hypothetical protein
MLSATSAQNVICNQTYNVGDLVFQILLDSNVPAYQFWNQDDPATVYELRVENIAAYDSLGSSWSFQNSFFRNWLWAFDCNIDCLPINNNNQTDNSTVASCFFSFNGSNVIVTNNSVTGSVTMNISIDNLITINQNGSGEMKFSVELTGSEIVLMLQQNVRLDLHLAFQCALGQCNNVHLLNNTVVIDGPITMAALSIAGQTVSISGNNGECVIDAGQESAPQDPNNLANPCGLQNYTIYPSGSSNANLTIQWNNTLVTGFDTIIFDPSFITFTSIAPSPSSPSPPTPSVFPSDGSSLAMSGVAVLCGVAMVLAGW